RSRPGAEPPILRDAGGSLTVESQYGSGSRFTIRLPASPVRARPASPGDETQAPAERRPNTVLVVDDDTAVSETMRHFIEKEGFHVVMAVDGQQGVKFARALKPVAINPGCDARRRRLGRARHSNSRARPGAHPSHRGLGS